MNKIRRKKKRVIPQSVRIKNVLSNVERDLEKISEYRRCFSEAPSQNLAKVDEYYRHIEQLGEDALNLVHLDNTQLYHPAVQWLLTSQRSRKFLRELHRGLEKGVKKSIGSIKGILGEMEDDKFANAVMVVNILKKDRKRFSWDSQEAYTREERQHLESWREKFLRELEKDESRDAATKMRLASDVKKMFPWDSTPKSYTLIQQHLEKPVLDKKGKVLRKPLIKKMTQQNFNRIDKRLFSLLPGSGPYYNVGALPPRPKKVPTEWVRAEKLIKAFAGESPVRGNQARPREGN